LSFLLALQALQEHSRSGQAPAALGLVDGCRSAVVTLQLQQAAKYLSRPEAALREAAVSVSKAVLVRLVMVATCI
jgi:hypothetical protein